MVQNPACFIWHQVVLSTKGTQPTQVRVRGGVVFLRKECYGPWSYKMYISTLNSAFILIKNLNNNQIHINIININIMFKAVDL